jgi:beta-lactamase class A
MFKHKIPTYYLLIAILSAVALSYFAFQNISQSSASGTPPKTALNSSGKECDYSFERLQGYKHIKPLVWVHPVCESQKYSILKEQLSALIQSYIRSGVLKSASFDLRDLEEEGDWASFNSEEQFSPGSLMKVQVMITVLRMAEDKPGLLDHEIVFDQPFQRNAIVRFPDVTIKPGYKYAVRELLQRMIQYSDNDANDLLLKNIDTVTLKKVFSDFGFAEVKKGQRYPITALQFSAYMEMLYNAGYLTIKDSEYAMDLLSICNFKQGMVSGLPDSVSIAHKFGESDDAESQQFHESGIIYDGDSPYLLTVMTRGPDIMRLPEVISVISKVIYDYKHRAQKIAPSGIVSK